MTTDETIISNRDEEILSLKNLIKKNMDDIGDLEKRIDNLLEEKDDLVTRLLQLEKLRVQMSDYA